MFVPRQGIHNMIISDIYSNSEYLRVLVEYWYLIVAINTLQL